MANFTPNQNEYNNMTPFKTWLKYQINTWGLNSFPFVESDFDDLTNYAMMMKLMKHFNVLIENQNMVEEDMTNLYNAFTELQTYLFDEFADYKNELNASFDEYKNQVDGEIEEFKTDITADFNELHDFVDNYFDNNFPQLVSDKLDEMASDGTLENLLNDTAHLTKSYNTYTEMMADSSSFTNGLRIQTLGYYSVNDGGGAEYYVNDSVVATNYQIELSNSLYLNLIVDDVLIIEKIGAYGDGTHDDTQTISDAITYCANNNKILSSIGKTYLISNDLTITNCNISFNYGKIISSQKIITLEANNHAWDYNGDRLITIENVKFHDTNVICNSPAITLQFLEFIDWHNIALQVDSVRTIDHIIYNNNRSDTNTISIKINVPDKVISRLQGRGGFTGIVINAMNTTITDSQLWLSTINRVNDTLDGSKFIHVIGGSGIMINNCVSDTYQYALYFEQNSIRGSLSNFQVINNNNIYKNCNLYFINKQEQLIGNAIFRLTNFGTDNITFHITHPCLLDINWFDGNPVDINKFDNATAINNLIQNFDGTAYDTTNLTHNSAPYLAIRNGNLYLSLDVTFTTPNTQKLYIDTSSMAGMGQVRGYQYLPFLNNNGTNDVFVTGYVSRANNNKILITSTESGFIKRMSFGIMFNLH